MKNIRNNVFETNSSSTHSISIKPGTNGVYDTIVPDDDGNIVLYGGEFGWEWCKYNDAETKANYAAVHAKLYSNRDIEMLKEVIMEHTGAKNVVLAIRDFDEDKSSYKFSSSYSYIDHQSVGTCNAAFADKESLKDFIFSPKSWLFTGNDNDTEPPNFYDTGDEIYTHKLVVDKFEETFNFKSKPHKNEITEALHDLCDRFVRRQIEGIYMSYMDRYHWEDSQWSRGKYDSLVKYDDGIVTLFKTKTVYDGKGNLVEEKLVDFVEYKFKLVEL